MRIFNSHLRSNRTLCMNNAQSISTVYCSSQDIEHSFDGLLREDGSTSWISEPNPQYPIEIILDMKGLFLMNGMDIVSHENMIATRVDLYGTKDEDINEATEWFSIGFFTFNSNQRSQWMAREFKHVSTDNNTIRYLRVIIEDAYKTPANHANRCSFVSLSINGRKEIKPSMNSLEELITDLSNAKEAAVEEENYGAAAVYKDELINISENHQKLMDLFDQKKNSMDAEDYLNVETILNEINRIIKEKRPDNPVVEILPEPEPEQFVIQDEEVFVKDTQPEVLPQKEEELPEPIPPKKRVEPTISQINVEDDGFFLTEFDQNTVVAVADNDEPETEPLPEEPPKPPKPPKRKKRNTTPPPSSQPPADSPRLPKKERMPKFSQPPSDAPPRRDEPDPLSDGDRAEAATIIDLFGESVAASCYSRAWSQKVSGYEQLCTLVSGLKSKGDLTRALAGMMPLMRRRFSDGLKAVYVSAVESTVKMLDAVKPGANELGTIVHLLLPISLGRLGDSNARINEVSFDFVLWAAERDKWALAEAAAYAVKPPASQSQYHIITAKLLLIAALEQAEGSRMKLADVMGIVAPALDSRKEEVRKAASKITLDMYAIHGTAVEKYMKNVPRLVREQLDKERNNQ